MGKAKPAHHTAKELAGKAKAATQNKGGGGAGKVDRLGGAAGHAKFMCPCCGQQVPDLKSGQAHWESKHSKMGPFDGDKWTDKHAESGGVTTAGVAVVGSKNKKNEPGKK